MCRGWGADSPFSLANTFYSKKKFKLHQCMKEPKGPGNGQTVTCSIKSWNVLRCTLAKQGFLQALWRRWCCSDRVMTLISFWPLACDYHFTSRCPSAVFQQCSLQWHYCYCCWKMKANKGPGHIHRATGFYKHSKIHNFSNFSLEYSQ